MLETSLFQGCVPPRPSIRSAEPSSTIGVSPAPATSELVSEESRTKWLSITPFPSTWSQTQPSRLIPVAFSIIVAAPRCTAQSPPLVGS